MNCSFPWQCWVNGLTLCHLYCYRQERSGPLKRMVKEACDFFIFRILSSRVSHVFGIEGDYVRWPSSPNLWRSAALNNLVPIEIKGKNSQSSINCCRETSLYIADNVCFLPKDVTIVWVEKRRKLCRVTMKVIPWPSRSLPHPLHQLFP